MAVMAARLPLHLHVRGAVGVRRDRIGAAQAHVAQLAGAADGAPVAADLGRLAVDDPAVFLRALEMVAGVGGDHVIGLGAHPARRHFGGAGHHVGL